MQLRHFGLVAIGLGLLFACKNDSPKGGQTPTLSPAPAPADTRTQVYLDGVYATSTAPNSSVYQLFDDDESTAWRTQAGAGPDEGVMLYFATPVPLKSLQVNAEAHNFGTPVPDSCLQLYLNGREGPFGKPGVPITLPEGSVRSLYIRVLRTGRETTTTVGEEQVRLVQFPANGSVALRSLTLVGTDGMPIHLVAPTQHAGYVIASSTLAPINAYSPTHLFDARREFVWCEGNPTHDGKGETLTFHFDQVVQINALKLWNGYQRSADHYSSNSRLREFSFGLLEGAPSTYVLQDVADAQTVTLAAPLEGKDFQFTIQSTYAGKRYKDMAISEWVFYKDNVPFVLTMKDVAQQRTAAQARASASPLASILNRRIRNDVEDGYIRRQSLILRDDGTFVLYSREIFEDNTADATTLADGNWELIKADANQATVKVFGKWYDLANIQAYYKGPTKQEVTKIFNDVLRIDREKISGTKMIGTFYLGQ